MNDFRVIEILTPCMLGTGFSVGLCEAYSLVLGLVTPCCMQMGINAESGNTPDEYVVQCNGCEGKRVTYFLPSKYFADTGDIPPVMELNVPMSRIESWLVSFLGMGSDVEVFIYDD